MNAIAGSNHGYVPYLIGDLGALTCTALEERIGSHG
jgi:hypothetical protein